MSADLLREAAALMRERASDVFDFHASPWRIEPGPAGWSVIRSAGVIDDDFTGKKGIEHDSFVFQMDTTSTAEHIASWHPAVALAVADLLEVVEQDVGTSTLAYKAAEAVARAYLGGAS